MSDIIDSLNSNGEYRARLTGILSGTALAGETLVVNWTIPSERVMNGADYEAPNRNLQDRITFQVVHPLGAVLDEFASRLFVRKEYKKALYGARLLPGLIIRVIYENNGTNDVEFNLNLDLHERSV